MAAFTKQIFMKLLQDEFIPVFGQSIGCIHMFQLGCGNIKW